MKSDISLKTFNSSVFCIKIQYLNNSELWEKKFSNSFHAANRYFSPSSDAISNCPYEKQVYWHFFSVLFIMIISRNGSR